MIGWMRGKSDSRKAQRLLMRFMEPRLNFIKKRSALPSLKFHRITSSRFNVNAGMEIPESVSDRGIVFFFHIYEIRSITRLNKDLPVLSL